jgi:hypothetical protein
MKFLLLLYSDPAADEALGPDGRRKVVDAHVAFAAKLRDRGAYAAGDALRGPETATTLRFGANGSTSVTDGPFLETKESLGGYYILDCADAAEARELAAQVPRSPTLVAELRPIADM